MELIKVIKSTNQDNSELDKIINKYDKKKVIYKDDY